MRSVLCGNLLTALHAPRRGSGACIGNRQLVGVSCWLKPLLLVLLERVAWEGRWACPCHGEREESHPGGFLVCEWRVLQVVKYRNRVRVLTALELAAQTFPAVAST